MEFKAEVRIDRLLNIRDGNPYRSYPVLRTEPAGTLLQVSEKVPGELIKGISAWYREDGSNHYFWSGGAGVVRLLPVQVSSSYLPAHAQRELVLSHTVRSGSSGEAVQRVQEWLDFSGYGCAVDGLFGPATERVVREFQAAQGLPVTGVVTPELFALLSAPMAKALWLPSPPEDPGRFSVWVRKVAEQHLAQRPVEIGGQNRGPWVRLYMSGQDGADQLWCAGFVSFVMQQAAEASKLPTPIAGSFGCDSLAAQAQQAGRLVPRDALLASLPPGVSDGGCWIFLNIKGAMDWDHTGFAFDFSGSSFKSLEGNADQQGSRNGWQVCSRPRSVGARDFIKLD
jgi:hypothetical protein